MSDLVQDLRKCSKLENPPWQGHVMNKAADAIERLQDAKRRALQLADERAIEANELRQQLEIAKKALQEIAAAPPSIAGRALIALTD
jgi:hypothetical protein